MLFALEPPGAFPVEAFTGFVQRSFPGGAGVHVATRRLQCLRNTHRAMQLALAQEEFAVLAEEDLEVADDVLEYLSWAAETYREDKDVVAVCAHARASRVKDSAAVARASWFNPLVWGTWRDRWEKVISPNWKSGHPSNTQSWDLNMQLLVSEHRYFSVFPVQSRVIHRGQVSTQTNWPLSEYFYGQFKSDCYSPHYEPQQYREVPFPSEPNVLVV
jgi:hypothetical protein